jgi:hypothetical protein
MNPINLLWHCVGATWAAVFLIMASQRQWGAAGFAALVLVAVAVGRAGR